MQTVLCLAIVNQKKEWQMKQETDVATDKCSCPACGNCIKLQDETENLLGKIDRLTNHNHNLACDLKSCWSANEKRKENEKILKRDLEKYKRGVFQLTKTIAQKQAAINNYINENEETKKQIAAVRCDYDKINKKLESYLNVQ